MKKAIKFLSLFILLILPVCVNAADSISVDCALDEAKPGEEVLCSVDGAVSSVEGISELKANLVVGEGLEIIDQRESGDSEAKYIIIKNNWQGDADLGRNPEYPDVNIGLYRTNPTSSSFSIFSMKVVVKNDATEGNKTITLNNVYYYANGDKIDIPSSSETIKVVKEEENPTPEEYPDLKELYVASGGVMTPTFSKDSLSYAVRLESAETTKFRINTVPLDENYSVSAKNTDTRETIDLDKDISFSPSLESKTMSIKVIVSSGDKSKEYTLIVDRPKPSTVGEATLASLIVGGVSVDLKSGVYDYSVKLNKEILKSYKIYATLTDPDNFKFSDYTKSIIDTNKSDSYPFEIQIMPKDSNSGYGSQNYIITIIAEDNGGNTNSGSGSGSNNNANNNVNNNVNTGSTSVKVVGIILILSFAGSIYYYKKNISEYE